MAMQTAHTPTTQTTRRSRSAEPKGLEALFLDTLKDIYYAEKKILRTLPKMAKAAQMDEVAAAFEKHMAETEGHVERLEQVFDLLDERPRGKTCPAIDGIIEEGSEIIGDYKGSPGIDAGLVAAAQAVEHYEMARYGTMVAWAQQLGMKDAAALLQATLDEEMAADKTLSALGEGGVNAAAAMGAAA